MEGKPIEVFYIAALERVLGKKAKIEMKPAWFKSYYGYA
jgi:hypothetical protein